MIGAGCRVTLAVMVRVTLLLPLLLVACSPAPDDPAAVSADDAGQLNAAAAELDVHVTGNTTP